jgi:hypothetical protein
MANPNPSPETRFKPGESGNPNGKTPEQKKNEMQAAEIAAELRLAALIRMQESVSGEGKDILELLDANALKLFKDSEDRAHGTPKATTEMSGPNGQAIPVTAVEWTVTKPPKREE